MIESKWTNAAEHLQDSINSLTVSLDRLILTTSRTERTVSQIRTWVIGLYVLIGLATATGISAL